MDDKVIKWVAEKRGVVLKGLGLKNEEGKKALDELVMMLLDLGHQLPRHIECSVDVCNDFARVEGFRPEDVSSGTGEENINKPFGFGYE